MELKIKKLPKEKFEGFKEEYRDFIKKEIRKQARAIKKHMEINGWNLDLDYYQNDIVSELLGGDLCLTLWSEVLRLNPNCKIVFENFRTLLKREDYTPVSYDSVKNELIVGEMKDTIDGRYVYLGPL